MPTYEYQCEACGHSFEQYQMMSDPTLRKCPRCRKSRLQRLIGAGAGIIFKGSGFYETDYKRKSPTGGGSSASASTGAGEAGSGSTQSDSGSAKDGAAAAKKETKASAPDSGK